MRLWKAPYVQPQLMREIQDILKKGLQHQRQALNITSRASTILPEFVGLRVAIHNGKTFEPLEIKDIHVGHKFGEYSFTRCTPQSVFENALKKNLAQAKKK